MDWSVIQKGISKAKDVLGFWDSATKVESSMQSVKTACDDYYLNPTEANKTKVRDSFQKYQEAMADTAGTLPVLPGKLGDLAEAGGFDPLSDLTKAAQQNYEGQNGDYLDDIISKYVRNERISQRDKERCRRAQDYFKNAKQALVRRDPLIVDLDGDGVETVGLINGTLFDHDGDGIRTGTGWVGADDGLLVLDRNLNGTIDSGAELFGVDTPTSTGTLPTNGFIALAPLDENTDGFVDENDSAFASLMVWRDLNGDGISQQGELASLSSLGIARLATGHLASGIIRADGNVVAATGSYVKSDGSTGQMASLDFVENRGDAVFVDEIEISSAVALLPTMAGVGAVRSLAEAATLSSALFFSLSDYTDATSIQEQRQLLGDLIDKWAATATSPSTGIDYQFEGISQYVNNDPLLGETAAYVDILRKLKIAEIFSNDKLIISGTSLTLTIGQTRAIELSYEALERAVFDSLLPRTILRPYFDAIVADEFDNIDYSALQAMLTNRIATDFEAGIGELAYVYNFGGAMFSSTGWDVDAYFEHVLSTSPVTAALVEQLNYAGIGFANSGGNFSATDELYVVFGAGASETIAGLSSGDNRLFGGDGDDIIRDDGGNDYISGGLGNDVISTRGGGFKYIKGGAGNDVVTFSYEGVRHLIEGGDGNDTIVAAISNSFLSTQINTFVGGKGNDSFESRRSTDTYIFDRGDGNDSIWDYGNVVAGAAAGEDTILFGEGIVASDLLITRGLDGNLIINIRQDGASVGDTITVKNWFWGAEHRIESFVFNDNSSLTAAQVSQLSSIINGTETADNISGYEDDNIIHGYGGNDVISDAGGSDYIDGGDGNDTITDSGVGSNQIYGGTGNDTVEFGYASTSNWIEGGDGNDTIRAVVTNSYLPSQVNTFIGGAGNDTFESRRSADTYIFNRGDGEDNIWDYGNALNGAAAGEDTISFGEGISAADLVFSRGLDGNLIVDIQQAGISVGDKITIKNWFWGSEHHIEHFVFENDPPLTAQQATQRANTIKGTQSTDYIYSFEDDNTIYGYGGNDVISDSGGSDLIDGGDGNDNITDSGVGSNQIYGGAGNDTIEFGYASTSNWIDGGDGNDTIRAVASNNFLPGQVNTFIGGLGYDTFESRRSADTYIFNRGDGSDNIWDYGNAINGVAAGEDTISFGDSISASDLVFSRGGDGNLVIDIRQGGVSTGDSITIKNWFWGSEYRIENFIFKNDTPLTAQQATVLANTIKGSENVDYIYSYEDDNTIYGFGGNDVISDSGGSDLIYGGDGNDIISDSGAGSNQIYGGAGNDTIEFGFASASNWIEGGDGNDTIRAAASNGFLPSQVNTFIGGAGYDTFESRRSADTYVFNRGDGGDSIWDYGNVVNGVAAGEDTISFGDGIYASDLVFSRGSDSSLVINIRQGGASSGDSITIKSWFSSAEFRIENFVFKNDAPLTAQQATQLASTVYGTENVDYIYTYDDDNTIYGLGGNDVISDSGGSDLIYGGDGNDIIYDNGIGANRIYGGAGNDTIEFGYVSSSNWIEGGDGNDTIRAAANNSYLPSQVNTFIGGAGYDIFESRRSADTYIFSRGDGSDSIWDYGTALNGVAAGEDSVAFGEGIEASDLAISQGLDGNLVIDIRQSGASVGDGITVKNWFWGGEYRIERFRFSDGSELSMSAMSTIATTTAITGNAQDNTLSGTASIDVIFAGAGADTLNAGSGDDLLFGGAGDDIINGEDGDDVIFGESGNDTINGGAGADTIYGGAGNDMLTGGSGNDIYVGGVGDDIMADEAGDDRYSWGRGQGADSISDGGGADTLHVLDGVAADQIWFSQNGSALELQVIGTSDKVSIQDWFTDSIYQIESFQLADGKTLNAAGAQALVSAMAAFTPPAQGQTVLTSTQQSQLGQVIASSWT